MNQLKSVYNIPFLDSYSHPKHTYLSMIAYDCNVTELHAGLFIEQNYVDSTAQDRQVPPPQFLS